MENTKTQTLGKIATEKMKSFIYKGDIQTKLLSSFYSSKSTNYASCLKEPPFVIITDKEVIVSRGFSRACKAVVTLDCSHPTVVEEVTRQRVAQEAADMQAVMREQTRARLKDQLPKRVADIAEALRVTVSREMFADRKANNQAINKAVGLVGYEYGYLGWNVVADAILEIL